MSYIRRFPLSTGFVQIIFFIIISTYIIPTRNPFNMAESINGNEISGLTDETRSQKTTKTSSTSGTGSIVGRKKRNKWESPRKPTANPSHRVITFKGAHTDLHGKVFIKGPLQAAKYDEAYKAILNHIGMKYDHRVYKAFEYKDVSKGTNLLTKPKAPMTTKVVQVATIGEDSKMVGKEVVVIDKDGEEYVEYQINLKQYMTDLNKFNSDLIKIFSLLIGQCSPSMEQSLAGEKEFSIIKEKSESIPLIKMIERICYNYQSHEFAPLGGWESLDRLSKTIQHEESLESEHYEKFKTVVEVCKASGINFAVMCSANVDMAMSSLQQSGTYKDGSYFALDPSIRKQVDEKAEEICLATRFLSLSSDKLHRQSKQELKNDLVKGDDKYPRTIAAALNFLQYHSLRGHGGLPRN